MSDGDYEDTACPDCVAAGRDTHGDNLRVWIETGGSYCIVCEEAKGMVKLEDVAYKPEPEIKINKNLTAGVYSDLPSRKITKKTCEYYSYQVNHDKKIHIANTLDESGEIVMQQHRTTKKDFPIFGNKDYKDRLYGQWLWTPSENVFITITEGQIDCLSVAQVFGLNYPVVSLPNGAPSAATIILKWMAYLCGFKYVVLCFDNDKTGHEAQQECVKLFPPGKVRYTNLVLKDPNEYLKSGRSDELKKAIYRAKEYLPDAILTGEKLLATLRNHKRKVRKWPWPTANLIISPIYCPAVYTIASWPGVGKTVTMADIIRDVIADGQKAGVISLEESIPNLLLKLSDNILGTDLRRLSNRELSEEEIESTRAITDSIVTFNHREYGSNVHEILKNLPYIAQSLNCEVIIFDNLSFSTTGLGDDERKNLDKAMLALKDSSTRYEYTLFNICHLNDDKEDFRECTMRGSRGIMMYSDQVIYLGRETESRGADRNQLMFYVKKDREFGIDTGKSFSLTYDPVLKRFVD